MRILVIGESCTDVYQYGDCVRLCPEAPVPVFKSSNYKTENPGMAMNVMENIKAISDMKADIITNNNWKEITKTRCVDNRTNYIIVRLDGNDNKYDRCDLEQIDYKTYDAIVISDYNKGFLTEEDIETISKKHTVTFLDTKKILGDWCRNITFIKINEFEYDRTKHKLNDQLLQKMIITLGPQGAKYKDTVYSVPKVEIKDTSGAGDTFIAALVANYVRTKKIDIAIKFANACATTVVQRKGVKTA